LLRVRILAKKKIRWVLLVIMLFVGISIVA
jgi:hypothetical protein